MIALMVSKIGVVFFKILIDCATGKKHKHKENQGNKSVMQTTNDQANIMSELAKYVTRMEAQLCALAA